MAMTEVDRDLIFLFFALTESRRAVRALEEVERLAAVQVSVGSGVEVRELQSVFDHIRLGLQFSSNVSKIFWPHTNAEERGGRLRNLVGLPESHPLKSRKLRNHIEHLDERLDGWTSQSPRPYLSTEIVLSKDWPDGAARQNVIDASAIVYDERSNSVILFGEEFQLTDLRAAVTNVREECSAAVTRLTAGLEKSTG